MNIQEYISSGIIESYVLGQLSGKECSELEALAKQYPEIKEEIEAVESALMDFSSKVPPSHLKQEILSKIELKELKTLALSQGNSSYATWLAAASVVLLIGSGIYNFVLVNELNSAEKQMAVLATEKEKIANEYESQTLSYQEMAHDMAIMMQPENKKVMLKGMAPAPDALAAIYWNQSTRDVYINVSSLPAPAADKQYQLWAIVDGKPVDAGVMDMDAPGALHKMKSIVGAEAFAVTLEKKGGSAVPTMTAMYLLGNV